MEKYRLTEKQKKYLSIKYKLDFILGVVAGIILLPVMLLIALAIKLDSPGPVLFKQKRVGQNKTIFSIWKFRTMQIDAPKDVPTHLLKNPEHHITKVGKFLRRTSLDELPQIYQLVLDGRPISICGPRPALWNQSDLIMEREKFGANDIKPGITGWAQINGRDELEIIDKARLDGEYIKSIGFWMDVKCFFGTIISVLRHDGIVEGGTGKLKNSKKDIENSEIQETQKGNAVGCMKMKKQLR